MSNQKNFTISPYAPAYESSWIICKTLSYLHSQFIDQMSPVKDVYSNEQEGYQEVIELVALAEDKVIGLIDVGIYTEERSRNDIYITDATNGAYLDAIAVHPDYQKMGVAQALFDQVINKLKDRSVDYLTIFTRDDQSANQFYKKKWGAIGLRTFSSNGRFKTIPIFKRYILC